MDYCLLEMMIHTHHPHHRHPQPHSNPIAGVPANARKAGSYDDGSQGGDGQWKVTLRKYPSNICPQLQTH